MSRPSVALKPSESVFVHACTNLGVFSIGIESLASALAKAPSPTEYWPMNWKSSSVVSFSQ